MPTDLSITDARRLTIAAQGFTPRRPDRKVGLADVRRTVDRMQVIQIDPINVLVRAQYLPVYARLGPYRRELLDRMADGAAELFETMAHDLSLVPVRLHRLLEWRMDARRHDPRWIAIEPLARELLAAVTARGPITLSDIVGNDRVVVEAGKGSWGRDSVSPGRSAMRRLRMVGAVLPVGRRGGEPVVDLRERVLPPEVLADPLPVNDARKELLVLAGRALGVGVASDLADYFRLGSGVSGRGDRHAAGLVPVAGLLEELVEEGRLIRCRVEGWPKDAYRDPAARAPKPADGLRALFGPFDPMIWDRTRARRLWHLDYVAEIYVPEAKRKWGYYVLPFLLGDRIVARVDLKADRAAGTLVVQASHAEPHATADEAVGPLADELADLARWLDLTRVDVVDRGDLARPLRKAVRAARS